jgi:CRISPR/Cas system CSM-associated protein Csm5 (group 7 of RAMP superfamily)
VYDIRNESSIENLRGKQIKNYSLNLIHDTEFEDTRKEVSDYLYELRNNPDYQVNSVYMIADRLNDPPENIAENS